MNIQHTILLTLGLFACEEKSETISEPEYTPSSCPDPVSFSIDESITVQHLRIAIGDGGLEDIECFELCQSLVWDLSGSDIKEEGSCVYNLDFETLPDDFAELEADMLVGTIECDGMSAMPCDGRRPLGYIEDVGSQQTLGAHFAMTAQLETASILAFVELSEQLKGWGAPKMLIDACLRAATDEVRHAHAFVSLAHSFNTPVPNVRRQSAASDMLHVALHNATEGCVFETWSALLAHHKSIHCSNPTLRSLYAQIAADETRHGQLAWDIHAWLLSQLNESDRALVIQAQRDAFIQLQKQAVASRSPVGLGLPTPQEAQKMAEVFSMQLSA